MALQKSLQDISPVLLNVASLAWRLQISPYTVYKRHSSRPWLLPPTCSAPGTRPLLWQPDAVERWLGERSREAQSWAEELALKGPRARRSACRAGRPTKAEQVARRLAAAGGAR